MPRRETREGCEIQKTFHMGGAWEEQDKRQEEGLTLCGWNWDNHSEVLYYSLLTFYLLRSGQVSAYFL